MKEKKTKSARWDLRIHPELDSRVKELAEKLGLSRNKTIEQIVWTVVLSPEKLYELCPTCHVPMFEVERIPLTEGVSQIECAKGHKHLYDFGEEKFVSID